MKKTLKAVWMSLLAASLLLCLVSCGAETDTSSLWESATYLSDTEFGSGSKTLTLEVTAGDKTVTFTVKTDKDTVGAALIEHGLIAGEDGPYGLYVKTVNGILADADTTQSYWGFNINGEMAMTGADATEIKEGETYQFVYTKA